MEALGVGKLFYGVLAFKFTKTLILRWRSSSIITNMILHCNVTSACCLAYFYFSFSDVRRQRVESLLRTLVHQLLLQRVTIPDGVKDIYKRFKHSNPSNETWIDALKVLISQEGHTFIVLDALDECPSHQGEQDLLLRTLQRFTPSQNQKFHLLVTSRKEPTIEAALQEIVTFPSLGIQNSDVDDDIRIHVQAQLASHPIMNTWPMPTQKEVEYVLTNKAAGM